VISATDLKGFPPHLLLVGDNELFRDECCKTPKRSKLMEVYFGTRLAEGGACVHLQNYKSMPHVFIVFERLAAAEMGYSTTSVFVRKVTRGEHLETTLEVVRGKYVEGVLDPGNYPIQFTKEEVWPAFGGRADRQVIARMEECVGKRREMK
jgi:hypothetical protein